MAGTEGRGAAAGSRAEGHDGQLGDARHIFLRLFDAVIPSLNGVCVLGGAHGRSQRCVCARTQSGLCYHVNAVLC